MALVKTPSSVMLCVLPKLSRTLFTVNVIRVSRAHAGAGSSRPSEKL